VRVVILIDHRPPPLFPVHYQVLVSELASPSLIPPPSSALAALFHSLHHACGLDVGGKAGAGTGGGSAGEAAAVVTDKRAFDVLAVRTVATVRSH
jgi:hypothetical protein